MSLEPEPTAHEITALLEAWAGGDEDAFGSLIPVVFADLRKLARTYFSRESTSTLEPTAVVHEVYLRLVDQPLVQFTSRAHFFGVASRLVRQVLIDHARSRKAEKRGGTSQKVPLSEALGSQLTSPTMEMVLAVHEALQRLGVLDQRKARLVELRYFCGLTLPEVSEVLEISLATAERDWTFARKWLAREINGGRPGDPQASLREPLAAKPPLAPAEPGLQPASGSLDGSSE